MFSSYVMYTTCLHCPYSELPAHGYGLGTYLWTYTMSGPARTCTWAMVPPWWAKAIGRASGQGCLKHLFHACTCMWGMPLPSPAHVQECLPIVIDWKPTTGLIPYRIQPGSAHGPCPPPADRGYRETQGAVRYLFYLSLSSGVLNRTSFQICGSWYLTMLLLGDGSSTLMNITSFIVLVNKKEG